MNKQAEKLADLIEKHPTAQFDIDNDMWYMVDGEIEITDSDKFGSWNTDWYADSSNYGAGIAEAFVVLLNRKGFNIKAAAV